MRRLPQLARPIAPALIVVLVLALFGCGVSASRTSANQTASRTPATATATLPTMPPTPTPGDPTGATWTLTGMLVDGVAWPGSAPQGRAITLQFRTDLGQLIGSSGCNGYGASYTLSGSALHVLSYGQTLIGCGPAVEAEETAYLAALLRVERFALSDRGATLTLSSDDGRVRLTYRRS